MGLSTWKTFINLLLFSEGWNFGPPEEEAKPVSSLVEQIGNLWEDEAKFQIDQSPQPHEAHYLKLDCSKARMKLGWKPKLELKAALIETVSWYREFQKNPAGIRQCTLDQIQSFSKY